MSYSTLADIYPIRNVKKKKVVKRLYIKGSGRILVKLSDGSWYNEYILYSKDAY